MKFKVINMLGRIKDKSERGMYKIAKDRGGVGGKD
jgi:hypothetical protein